MFDSLDKIALPLGISLVKLVETAFELSKPLHYAPGPLLPGEAQALINAGQLVGMPVSLGTVKGRVLNLTVFQDLSDSSGRLYLRDRWHSHSAADFELLLSALGVDLGSL